MTKANQYGPKAQKEVKEEMHRFKHGEAHSGTQLKPVKNRKQAIAIALSKARKNGAKVPEKPANGSTTKSSTKAKSNSTSRPKRR